ncbi:MAG: hypothetical protein RLZZ450_2553 [Pseudomonadota bacterium]
MNERILPSHWLFAPARRGRALRQLKVAMSCALCVCATACTLGAPDEPTRDVELTPSTVTKLDAAVVDAARPAVLEPSRSDASVRSLDAGVSIGPVSEMRDASAREDAQPPRSDAAIEMDFCGQPLPADPSASGVMAESVLVYSALAQHPSVLPRGPAISGPFGARVMWIFGETRSREDASVTLAEASYTLSGFDRRYELGEAAADAPLPIGFVPPQTADLALLADGDTLHYELGSLIAVGPTESLLFYSPSRRSTTTVGVRDERIGTRVVRVKTDLSSIFIEPQPELLFPASAPSIRFGLTGRDGNVYLYGCQEKTDGKVDCLLARASAGSANLARGYQYRTVGGWSNDPSSAISVLNNAHRELSVSFNPYLRRYLAVFLIGRSNQVALHTAERPEGPFTRLATVVLPRSAGATGELSVAVEHPELASKCGRHLTLTYVSPLDDGGSEVRPVEFDLR